MKKRTLTLDKEILTVAQITVSDAGYSAGNALAQFLCDTVVGTVMELVKEVAKGYSAGARDCTQTQTCPSNASNCATCIECWSTYVGGGDEAMCQ